MHELEIGRCVTNLFVFPTVGNRIYSKRFISGEFRFIMSSKTFNVISPPEKQAKTTEWSMCFICQDDSATGLVVKPYEWSGQQILYNISIHVFTNILLFTFMCIFCVCVCIFICVCVWGGGGMCVYVCACVCMCACGCLCMSIYVYLCLCMHVCVCLFVWYNDIHKCPNYACKKDLINVHGRRRC